MLDDAEVAALVHDRLAPTASYYSADGSGGVFTQGATSLLLGDLARVAGRFEEALWHYPDAVSMDVRIGARPFTALSRLGWAQTLLAADRELDPALRLCEQAAAEFRRLDMPGPLATATEVMLAIESARRSASPLSAREVQVAELVAEALTNREIADRLVLSERTVETHVRSILGKLGFTTRTEIATWVVQAPKLRHHR
jgi:DNA-binding CsgD family transcriptional regulator